MSILNILQTTSHWDHLRHPNAPHAGTPQETHSCTEKLKQYAGVTLAVAAVGLFGLPGLGAAIGVGGLYAYKAKEKLAHTKELSKRAEKQEELTIKPNPLNDKVIQVIKQAREKEKKIKLIIGRTSSEPLPKENNTLFVSLDIKKDAYSYSDVKKRLHLCMDIDKSANINRLQNLFDEVIVDYSTLKYISKPWVSLKPLLDPSSQSKLITEIPNIIFGVEPSKTIPSNWKEQGIIYISKQLMINPDLSVMKDNFIQKKQNEIEGYLGNLFHSVKRIDNKPYPTRNNQFFQKRDNGQSLKSSFFILTHPK